MAALSDRRPIPLIDLREVSSAYLAPVLEEEIAEWRADLDWDFRPSADLVKRFVDMHGIAGFALPGGQFAAGYGYYVCEEGKGLIGGLYVGRRHRSIEDENSGLGALLESMLRNHGTKRL